MYVEIKASVIINSKLTKQFDIKMGRDKSVGCHRSYLIFTVYTQGVKRDQNKMWLKGHETIQE